MRNTLDAAMRNGWSGLDFELSSGVIALYICLSALVLVYGGILLRDHRRHFHMLRTARAHGLEPVGMIIGRPDVVIGIALGPGGPEGDRFGNSTLCAVIDGKVERLDSEVVWSMKRSGRLVWYGLLRFTGGIGRENLMGFLRWDSRQRRVPAPDYADLNLERSMLFERTVPLLVVAAVAAWLFFYMVPRI